MKTLRFTALMACVLAAALLHGCATCKKPSNEELIRAQLDALEVALKAKDIEKSLSLIAEDFYQSDLGDKAGVKDMIKMGIDMGYIEDGQLVKENMKIVVTGETATAGPIDATSTPGSVTIQIELKKVKGLWLISGGGEY